MRPRDPEPTIGSMPSPDVRRRSRPAFLVECYWPGVSEADFRDHVATLDTLVPRGAARAAGSVVHLGSALAVDDEVILSLFRASGLDQLRVLLAARGVTPDRIVAVRAARGRGAETGLRARDNGSLGDATPTPWSRRRD